MNHAWRVKKTCLTVCNMLNGRVNRNSLGVVKTREELLEITDEVIASWQEAKTELKALVQIIICYQNKTTQ